MKRKLLCILLTAVLLLPVQAWAETADRFDQLEQALPQLEALLAQCETAGLDVGYERADWAVIRDFIDYGRQDLDWGDDVRAEYVADCLDALYADTAGRLNAYLDGTKQPLPVKRNLPEDFGGAWNGDFVDDAQQPVFQNGFGVFDQLKNDLYKLQEFGGDIAQIEIGPNSVLAEKGSVNGWGTVLYGGAQAAAEVVAGGRDGTGHAMKISNASSNGYLAMNQNVTVRPNTTYVLTVHVKTEAAGTFWFSPQGWTADRATVARGTNGWTEYTVEYTTGDGEYNMEILFVSSSVSTAVYLDDMTLCRSGSDTNILQNGDFEDSAGAESAHFQANTARIRNSVTRALDDAYESGVMVNVLISPHYFPGWILEQYPEAAAIDSGMGYDMNHPVIQEALDLYIKTLMGEIKAHPALHSVCITNEPTCDTRTTQGLDTEYSAYLQELYQSDIAALNAVYGSAYTDFSQVRMPASDTMDAAYYDWVQFNNQYTADWHRFLAETVKKYAPEVAVHAKIMTIFGKSDSLNYGIDPEDFAEFTDYNGNDAWGFYGQNAGGLLSKLMWYDLLDSIKPSAPIINSEDHIIEDRNTNYSPNQAIHVGADIWQGAVHGRDASIVWIWGRTQDQNANTYGNILYRPDVLSAFAKGSFDLNRLSGAVAALQEGAQKATILYAPTSRAYSAKTVRAMKLAYEAALYAGANPGFITERQLAAGVMPQGVLIIPNATQVQQDAYDAIAAYKNQGGTVLALGTDCLSRDAHNRARASSVEFDETIPVTETGTAITAPTAGTVQEYIAELAETELLAGPDGASVTGVEQIRVEYDGAELLNLCSYTWDGAKQVAIDGTAQDLLTGTYYTNVVELQPFEPVLLEFKPPKMTVQADVAEAGDKKQIRMQLENQGGAADILELTVQIANRETGQYGDTVRIKKYVVPEGTTSVVYEFLPPQGTYTAYVNGVYSRGQIEEIQLDIE